MNKSTFIILAFVCLLKPGDCLNFKWKNFTQKLQNITGKIAKLPECIFSSRPPVTWRWKKPEVNRPNDTFIETIFKIEYLFGQEWYAGNYRDRNPALRVPGGYCPSYWSTRWRGYKGGCLHNLCFKYWWKWKGSMMSIQLKSDFFDYVHEPYMLKVSNALRTAAVCLIKEFSEMKEQEQKEKSFWEKLESKFGVRLGESEEWYNYT